MNEVEKIKDLTGLLKEIYKNLPEKWEEMGEYEELKEHLHLLDLDRSLNDLLDCIRPLILKYGYRVRKRTSFLFLDNEKHDEVNENDLWETADGTAEVEEFIDKDNNITATLDDLFVSEEESLDDLVEDIENINDINDYKSVLQKNIAKYFTLIEIPSEKSSYLDNEIIYEDEIIKEEYDLRLKEETYDKIIKMGLVPVITFECDPDPMNTWLRVGLYGARPEYLATYIRVENLSREEGSKLFWINKDLEGVIINPHIV